MDILSLDFESYHYLPYKFFPNNNPARKIWPQFSKGNRRGEQNNND